MKQIFYNLFPVRSRHLFLVGFGLLFLTVSHLRAAEASNILPLLTDKERLYLSQQQAIRLCLLPQQENLEALMADGSIMRLQEQLFPHFSLLLNKPISFVIGKDLTTLKGMMRREECEIMPTSLSQKSLGSGFRLTAPLFPARIAIATAQDVLFIGRFSALKGKTFLYPDSFGQMDRVQHHYPGIADPLQVDDLQNGLRMVVDDKAFGMIAHADHLVNAVRQFGISRLHLTSLDKLESETRFALLEKNSELLSILKKLFKSAPITGFRAQFDEGENLYKRETDRDETLLWQIVAVILLIILFVIVLGRKHEGNVLFDWRYSNDRETRVSNRAWLDQALAGEIDRCNRYGTELSLIIVEIDHLAQINNQFGRKKGNKAFTELAALLNDNTRKSDTVGRWTNEEFLIICPNIPEDGAVALAELLRTNAKEQTFSNKIHLTISLGVSSYQTDGSAYDLIQRVERALYRSKSEGHDRVSVAKISSEQ